MFFTGGFNLFLNVVNWLLEPLQNINWNFDVSFIEPIIGFFRVIFYLLPIRNLLPLFFLVITIINFKNIVAILKTVMQILPFV